MRKIYMLLAGLVMALGFSLTSTAPANAAVCGTGTWVSSSVDGLAVFYDDEVAEEMVGFATQVRVMNCSGGMKIATHVRSKVYPQRNGLNCDFLQGIVINPSAIGSHNPAPKRLACWSAFRSKSVTWDIPNQTLWSNSDRTIEQTNKFEIRGMRDDTFYGVARKTV